MISELNSDKLKADLTENAPKNCDKTGMFLCDSFFGMGELGLSATRRVTARILI